MKNLKKQINLSLSKGWKMSKLVHSGGLFSDATYDYRTVCDREQLSKLAKEGFSLEDNPGLIALNILLELT